MLERNTGVECDHEGKHCMKIDLFTASFPRFEPGSGVPVRTSRGFPRYQLRYRLEAVAPSLMPDRSMFGLGEAFDAAYRAKLDGLGVDRIAAELHAIAERARDEQLVLLCFEADRADCHRGSFSAWWLEQTGEEVPELGGPATRQEALW